MVVRTRRAQLRRKPRTPFAPPRAGKAHAARSTVFEGCGRPKLYAASHRRRRCAAGCAHGKRARASD
eukprot:scaffold117647_cov32-Tisochrysis_lutea.AAC.3